MKKILLSVAIFSFSAIYAQEISLDKIYSGYYRGKGIAGISSLNDGEHYAVIESNGIAKYAYKTTEKSGYIVSGSYQSYEFSNDESKILLLTESFPVYRHSFLGVFRVKDLKTGQVIDINNGKPIQEPKFSPDATKIAFVADNNLFYQDLNTNKIIKITSDGKKNEIINGLADWVYEEEFGHSRQYEWTQNSNAIVFIKSDESQVKEVLIPIYNKNLYPQEMRFKYPKAGEENSKVSAHLYKLDENTTIPLNLSQFKNCYIPNVLQTAKPNEIILITSHRTQNASDILKVNTQTAKVDKLFTEVDSQWIDTDNVTLDFLEDNSFIWASERSGFRHLYWYHPNGKLKKQITKGKWEVTDYYGYNPSTKEVYIQTTQNGSINKVISKTNIISGKTTIISNKEGNNSANFSKNYRYFIETHSTALYPHASTLKNSDGTLLKELQNNNEQLHRLKEDNFSPKSFFTIPNKVGDQMNAYIIKPKDFDTKRIPHRLCRWSWYGLQRRRLQKSNL